MQLLTTELPVPVSTEANGQPTPHQQDGTKIVGHADIAGGITIVSVPGPGTTRYLYSPERRELTRRNSPGNMRRTY